MAKKLKLTELQQRRIAWLEESGEDALLLPQETCMVCTWRQGTLCTLRDMTVKASTPACEEQNPDGLPF